MPAPDLEAVAAYLGDASSWTEDQVTEALAAETAAQAAACTIPLTTWPADLTEALKRRVARNLAMRALPLGAQASISEVGVGTFRPGSDSEVRRLEAPHRRHPVG
jgi:hypothetical protein